MDDIARLPAAARLEPLYRAEAQRFAREIAVKPVEKLLGKKEFELRDRLLRLGAASVEAAFAERKKGGGTQGLSQPRPVQSARRGEVFASLQPLPCVSNSLKQ